MPRLISNEQWDAFFALLARGRTRKEAAELANISTHQADRVFADPDSTSGAAAYRRWMSSTSGKDIKRGRRLSKPAEKALADFLYFRRRFYGRAEVPWAAELAQKIDEWLYAPERVYAVVNLPPGVGKTTFVRDLVNWLTTKDRTLSTMWGSRIIDQATLNTVQIRDEFTRTLPLRAGVRDLELGLATDAESTLMGDYGRFRPDQRGETNFWAQNRFTVVSKDGEPTVDKEPSVTAFGFDGGYLGGRYRLIVWDDVDDLKTIKASEDVRETFFNQWGQVAENRLEPGGLFLLVMQRLGATDISRHCLDQVDLDGKPVYQHFVLPAHFDLECKDDHGPDAKPYGEGGCLLDPKRLPWVDLIKKMADRHHRYRVTYQQEETDPDSVLVPALWVNGGIDPETGEDFVGCWDMDRALLEIPKDLPPGCKTLMTIDPSGTKFWAIETWITHSKLEKRWLIDCVREPLGLDDLLEQEVYSGKFKGKVEDMWQRATKLGFRPSHVIPEYNALQRLLFHNRRWEDWRAQRNVILVPHYTTGKNKPDEETGPDILRDPFKYGRIRLPGKSRQDPNMRVFVYEHTNFPFAKTDDTVMADWFAELRYRSIFPPVNNKRRKQHRPGFVAVKDRYAAARLRRSA